jgi:plasmid maintenance system killer protein
MRDGGALGLEIEFKSNHLERSFVESSRAIRQWGAPVGRKYVERVVFIQAAGSVADLRKARSLRFHALAGKRLGEYGIMLTGNWRLIVSLPQGEAGSRVRIEEVVDYHGS